jgi:hypothetical protein
VFIPLFKSIIQAALLADFKDDFSVNTILTGVFACQRASLEVKCLFPALVPVI